MRVVFTSMLLLSPAVVAAQTTVQTIIGEFGGWVSTLFPLALGASLLLFAFGIARFIFEVGSDDGRRRGRALMIWGVIALFISVSLWGIVSIAITLFGLDPDVTCPPTQLNDTADGEGTAC
ncbi:hypothetical protein GVX82_03920 [Patescibacteria group bacterium]|jgi:MFS family permease|nr:hypothetical protein [Patescibacteria group bacterium]